jgi:acyl-coenzyme A synthetase/AMP-(fatty) acid ligase
VSKGVLVSSSDLIRRACAEVSWLGLNSKDVLLSILPFSFDVGLNQLLASLVAGAELVILESWLPADVLGVVAARGVTGIAAVPSIWLDFMKQQRVIDRVHAHRSLRFLTVSGGDLSAGQHVRLLELAGGAEIFKTYGQTETFRTSSLRPEEYAARPLSVGRALPGVRLYICRADGTRAEAGETGEVVHTGTGSMLGYLGADPTPTKLGENPWRSVDDPNPLAIFTGDLGRLDEEGYLYLLGRRDDLVKISGNRVYPSEQSSSVTARPDARLGRLARRLVARGARAGARGGLPRLEHQLHRSCEAGRLSVARGEAPHW